MWLVVVSARFAVIACMTGQCLYRCGLFCYLLCSLMLSVLCSCLVPWLCALDSCAGAVWLPLCSAAVSGVCVVSAALFSNAAQLLFVTVAKGSILMLSCCFLACDVCDMGVCSVHYVVRCLCSVCAYCVLLLGAVRTMWSYAVVGCGYVCVLCWCSCGWRYVCVVGISVTVLFYCLHLCVCGYQCCRCSSRGVFFSWNVLFLLALSSLLGMFVLSSISIYMYLRRINPILDFGTFLFVKFTWIYRDEMLNETCSFYVFIINYLIQK